MNTADEREIKRKLKVLRHAEQGGNTAKTCRYFGVIMVMNSKRNSIGMLKTLESDMLISEKARHN